MGIYLLFLLLRRKNDEFKTHGGMSSSTAGFGNVNK